MNSKRYTAASYVEVLARPVSRENPGCPLLLEEKPFTLPADDARPVVRMIPSWMPMRQPLVKRPTAAGAPV